MSAPEDGSTIDLIDNPAARRFEVHVDGALAGSAEYVLQGGRIVLTHTEVSPAYDGRGLGSRLAAFALDQARDRGLKVVPVCPFISSYLRRHPEYADLV